MFLDSMDMDLTYWPTSLKEGETSEVIEIQVETPFVGYLRATNDARARVWAKWMMFPANPFINISAGSGINLDGLSGPFADFAVYVEALSPIDGFERVPLTVVQSENRPAGWTV